MRIMAALACPRLVYLGSTPVLISPPSLRHMGTLFGFIEDHVERPPDADDGWRPSLRDGVVQAALSSPAGLGVLLYVAMIRDQPQVTIAKAFRLATKLDEADHAILHGVVFGREEAVVESHFARWRAMYRGNGNAETKTLDRSDVGAMIEEQRVRRFPPDVVGNWTLAQLENKRRGGLDPNGDENGENIPMSPGEMLEYMQFCRAEAQQEMERNDEYGQQQPG